MPSEVEMPMFSVIVPVYQSDASVVELVDRITAVFDRTVKKSFEIILIDDGSDLPQTWPTLAGLAEADDRVRAIRLMRNYGKPAAVLCGFCHVRGDWAITIDDDLQQSPEDIINLLAFRDHDVVVATYSNRKHSLGARATSWIKGWFDAHVLRVPLRMSPLKLIRRQTVDQLLKIRAGRPYIPALLAHVTSDFKAVEAEHKPSKAGKSRYNYRRRIRQFSNLVISNSGLFARIWSLVGLLCVTVGGVLTFGLLLAGVIGSDSVTIEAFLLAALLIIGGMILMALGVVGEYLIRIVELTSERPAFVVRQIVGAGPAAPDSLGGG